MQEKMINNSRISRQVFGILNLAVVCFYLLSPNLPYLEYILKRKYIEKTLCVEKDKAENTCHGKCYLHAQLEKSSKSSDAENDDKKNIVPDRRIDDHLKVSSLAPDLFRHENIIMNNYRPGLSVSFIPDIFRPPEL